MIHHLKRMLDLIGADSAAVMNPDLSNKVMYCSASVGMPKEWVGIKNSFDVYVSGGNVEVYKSGKSAITNQLQTTLKGYFIESVMIVPVYHGEEVIAVVEFIHDKNKKIFTIEDQFIVERYLTNSNVALDAMSHAKLRHEGPML